jgi:hypothetical protein
MSGEVIKRMAEHVARQSSRRRFLARLGKLTAVAAGLFVGERFTTQTAFAAVSGPLCCDSGGSCPGGNGYSCPLGMHEGSHLWICCYGLSHQFSYRCHDCIDRYGRQLCGYATYVENGPC